MLSENEKDFVSYWAENRLRKKKVLRQLSVGLPIGVLFVASIFSVVFARWDKHADLQLQEEMQYTQRPTLILVLIGAALLIVTFFVIFSAKHNWDLNEQRYKELCARSDKDL